MNGSGCYVFFKRKKKFVYISNEAACEIFRGERERERERESYILYKYKKMDKK